MRRLLPWWVLAILFVGVPVLEIYLIVRLGQTIGVGWTILLLLADGVLGSWLVKREGGRAWGALREALGAGRVPSRELADGALILVGGTLLLAPGFVSDVVGLVCILPFTRPLPRRLLTRTIARRLLGRPTGPAGRRPDAGSGGGNGDAAPDPGVVRGEVIE